MRRWFVTGGGRTRALVQLMPVLGVTWPTACAFDPAGLADDAPPASVDEPVPQDPVEPVAPVDGDTPAPSSQPSPPGGTLRIEALIDGESQLELRGTTARWRHRHFAAPGRWDGALAPTILGVQAWYPGWPDVPDAENRDCQCTSTSLDTLAMTIPGDGRSITLQPVTARGPVAIAQQPDASNQHTLILQFDDDERSGASQYVVDLVIAGPP